jgi:hypothetical protein
MKRKRSYAAVDVEQLYVEALLPLLTPGSKNADQAGSTNHRGQIARRRGARCEPRAQPLERALPERAL